MLDIDATFNLTYMNGHKTENTPQFNLNGSTVDAGSSSCGNVFVGTTSILSARTFPTRELLMFTFGRENGAVSIAIRFTLNAKNHFKDMNATTLTELNSEKDLPIGQDTPTSYKCVTEEIVAFRPNNNFMLTMIIRNLQVQAYRIKRSIYGPIVECIQDLATSTPLPETTVVANFTTNVPQPETTTEIPTNTTTEPRPETIHPIRQNTTPVLPITTTEPLPETSTPPEPETTTPVQQNTTTEPLPETSTPPEPETTTPVQPNTTTEPLTKTSTPPEPETSTLIQPNTTTEPLPTPPEPETTTTPKIETKTTMTPTTQETHGSKYVIRDNNEVCIVFQGHISFDIPFQKTDGSIDTATIAIPDSVKVNGNCSYSDIEQEISLTFFKSQWRLDIVIAKESKSLLQYSAIFKALSGSSDYSWQAVTLTYVMDSHFPDSKYPGIKIKAAADGRFGKFKANTDGSYKCNADQDLEFGNDKKMKMNLSKMQYRAFGQTNSSDFSSTGVFECPADTNNGDKGKGHKTLGIALGCAIAGLIIIVFVACCITRYRNKKPTEYSTTKENTLREIL